MSSVTALISAFSHESFSIPMRGNEFGHGLNQCVQPRIVFDPHEG